MQTADFRYHLPEQLIAQFPAEQRTQSRLQILDGEQIRDEVFSVFPDLLRENDLLVLNDTRVMPARLYGNKETGGKIELLLERLLAEDRALAQIRASKAPKPGARLKVGDGWLQVLGREGDMFVLQSQQDSFHDLMQAWGHMPLPPYIQRDDEDFDQSRYQTVYARHDGSVAAPTAGLHFDDSILQRVAEKGVQTAHVTLHVGAGTFQPVRVRKLSEHTMHSEWLSVSEAVCNQVEQARRRGGRVIAVGTTSVRSLETAARDGALRPYAGDTQLFITPGYRFKVVDALLTNFHLPESTLLMLVCAFGGYERVMKAYRHAVAKNYRFFSYGDAMFLSK